MVGWGTLLVQTGLKVAHGNHLVGGASAILVDLSGVEGCGVDHYSTHIDSTALRELGLVDTCLLICVGDVVSQWRCRPSRGVHGTAYRGYCTSSLRLWREAKTTEYSQKDLGAFAFGSRECAANEVIAVQQLLKSRRSSHPGDACC